MPIPLQELLNKIVRTEHEKNKKEITSWHISKLGNCLRGVYLERLGKEPDQPFDDRTLRVFSVGKMFEDWLIDKISKRKDVKTQTQVRVEDKKLDVSGYVDLILEYEEQKRVYEIKSKHPQAFWYMIDKKEGAMKQHEYQLWMYLYLLNIEEGSLVYISKGDQAIIEYPIRKDDKRLKKEVMDILKVLNECWLSLTLPPLPDPKSWQTRFCPFHKQCLEMEK